jgi:1D-myo-inositol-triphosphate 3-kinase
VDKPGTILKKLDKTELAVYKRLKDEFSEDSVFCFTPSFYGEVTGMDENDKPAKFIRIKNLLTGFSSPKVVDIKLGVRTFMESECDNPKPRPDLFKRMLELYPDVPTAEERETGAVTKHRWMTTRDAHTTISSLGFRVDGIAGYKHKERETVDKELTAAASIDDVVYIFDDFVQAAAVERGAENPEEGAPLEIAEDVLMHLERLYQQCTESEFVRQHEFIGSSLLVIADAYGNTGVSWIDFAKTARVPEGISLTHTSPWEPGNHEDGILIGLENLVRAWSRVVGRLRMGATSTPWVTVVSKTNQACMCGKWRQRRSTQRRRTNAKKLTLASDLKILNALPGFSGSRQLKDPRALGSSVMSMLTTSSVGSVDSSVLSRGSSPSHRRQTSTGGAVIRTASTATASQSSPLSSDCALDAGSPADTPQGGRLETVPAAPGGLLVGQTPSISVIASSVATSCVSPTGHANAGNGIGEMPRRDGEASDADGGGPPAHVSSEAVSFPSQATTNPQSEQQLQSEQPPVMEDGEAEALADAMRQRSALVSI